MDGQKAHVGSSRPHEHAQRLDRELDHRLGALVLDWVDAHQPRTAADEDHEVPHAVERALERHGDVPQPSLARPKGEVSSVRLLRTLARDAPLLGHALEEIVVSPHLARHGPALEARRAPLQRSHRFGVGNAQAVDRLVHAQAGEAPWSERCRPRPRPRPALAPGRWRAARGRRDVHPLPPAHHQHWPLAEERLGPVRDELPVHSDGGHQGLARAPADACHREPRPRRLRIVEGVAHAKDAAFGAEDGGM